MGNELLGKDDVEGEGLLSKWGGISIYMRTLKLWPKAVLGDEE